MLFLNEIPSTNSYLKQKLSEETIKNDIGVWTNNQTQGKGQAKNSWFCGQHQDIALSFLHYPSKLEAIHQFNLTVYTSISLIHFLASHNIYAEIKWPNDIYVNHKKIAGILIENSISGKFITNSIIGIGININSTEFPNDLPNPVSLKLLTNKTFDLNQTLQEIHSFYKKTWNEDINELKKIYLQKLYKKNVITKFIIDNKTITGKIIGVNHAGMLIIADKNNTLKEYWAGEIKIIK
jgi:BirA family transcriptional regulator, biotin operon repressor / biotin---[acetyl-CoA-carboxylase] ligase